MTEITVEMLKKAQAILEREDAPLWSLENPHAVSYKALKMYGLSHLWKEGDENPFFVPGYGYVYVLT